MPLGSDQGTTWHLQKNPSLRLSNSLNSLNLFCLLIMKLGNSCIVEQLKQHLKKGGKQSTQVTQSCCQCWGRKGPLFSWKLMQSWLMYTRAALLHWDLNLSIIPCSSQPLRSRDLHVPLKAQFHWAPSYLCRSYSSGLFSFLACSCLSVTQWLQAV